MDFIYERCSQNFTVFVIFRGVVLRQTISKIDAAYEVLERTNEDNYRIRKPSDPRSRSKVVPFNKLKLYQRKQGESTRGQERY